MTLIWPVQLVVWWLQFVHIPYPDNPGVRYSGRVNTLPLPASLAPPWQEWNEVAGSRPTPLRTPEKGCSLQGAAAPAWYPNRALLWLFLRWPLECEVMHWLQKCDRDHCDGVRGEHYFDQGLLTMDDANRSHIIVRCDEFGRNFGPMYAVEYMCMAYTKQWTLCQRQRSFYSSRFNPGSGGHTIEDVPCATPEMIKMREYWRSRGGNWLGVPPDQQ